MMKSDDQWTKPYHGVSHFKKFSSDRRWATINDHGSFVTLVCWNYLGPTFSSPKTTFESIADAKKAGQSYVNATNLMSRRAELPKKIDI